MKRYFLFSVITIFSLLAGRPASAQVNNGETLNIPAGIYMNIQGDTGLINNGTINNDGTIILEGNFENNGAFNSGPFSQVKLDGPDPLGSLLFQKIGGTNTTTFNDLIIGGTNYKRLDKFEYIRNKLIFDTDSANKVVIGSNNLTLLPIATISNPWNNRYVVTNGTGLLVKELVPLASPFLFPVGDALAANCYKPVTLNYGGTIDTFSVRVMAGVLPTTGSATTDDQCVQYTYLVEESNLTGSTASLKLGWNATSPNDEGSAFNRPQAHMWQDSATTFWNMLPGAAGAAPSSGGTGWEYQTLPITDFSPTTNRFILRSYQPLVVLPPANDTVCQNNTASFSVTATGTPPISYQWQEDCGGGWTNISPTNTNYSGTTTATLTIINAGIGLNGCQYRCVVTDLSGTVTTAPATLTVHTNPVANAGPDVTVLIGNSTQLNVTPSGGTYTWVPSTYLNDDNIQNPICTPAENITYIVQVTDANGCIDVDTINVIVDDQEVVFVPTAFSPNGYWQNATLYVNGKGVKELNLIVYDRWGEKIFETNTWNDVTTGWDGTYKGEKLSTAVFVYYLSGIYYSGNTFNKSGNVTLIR